MPPNQTPTLLLLPDAVPPNDEQKVLGFQAGWNVEYCCGTGWKNGTSDSEYVAFLIRKALQDHALTGDQVCVAGLSNGAMLTMKVANDHPDLVGSVVAASGSIGTKEKRMRIDHPVPILLMHGEKDTIVPFRGGPGASDASTVWLPFNETRKAWQAVNQSTQTPTKVLTFAGEKHRWHDMRVYQFWKKKPAGSQELRAFLDSLID